MEQNEYIEREQNDGIDIASRMSKMLNVFGGGHSQDAFLGYWRTEHRTLQQRFTALCFEWIKMCAKQNYDLRNEQSVKVCKQVVEKMGDQLYFPFI